MIIILLLLYMNIKKETLHSVFQHRFHYYDYHHHYTCYCMYVTYSSYIKKLLIMQTLFIFSQDMMMNIQYFVSFLVIIIIFFFLLLILKIEHVTSALKASA